MRNRRTDGLRRSVPAGCGSRHPASPRTQLEAGESKHVAGGVVGSRDAHAEWWQHRGDRGRRHRHAEQLYSDLGNVLDIVHAVADEENNVRLDQALDDVEAAYADNDRDGFINGIDRIVELFDAFYTADCDG